ncbi:MAG TPA: PAS domain S-box protein [Thermodesulfobacteriota bacterium]|nr:PAS domain S-box protein [Thermodesulfobacteriota bacterium]
MSASVKKVKKEPVSAIAGQEGKAQPADGGTGTDEELLEKNYSLIVESVPSGIVMTNHRGKILFVNSLVNKMFGYEPGELVGETIEVLVPERFRRIHTEFRYSYQASPSTRPMGRGRELFACRKDGTEFPVEIGLNPVQTKTGMVVLSTIVDITDRKLVEKLVREGDEKFRRVLDNTSDAVLVFDSSGRVETTNRAGLELFAGDGGQINEIWEIITPERRQRFANLLERVREGAAIVDHETEMLKKSGGRVPVSISLVYMEQGGGRFIETVRDISARIAMRNKIVELEKAQIVGRMAEGFAHHMGTPLASMLLRVQMLKDDMKEIPECGEIGEKLDSIERQILYGQKVIQRLLRFVSNPRSEKAPENLSEILTESLDMVRPLLRKHGITAETDTDPGLVILSDPNLLHLVFSDAVMNAVDAMPGGGKLTITANGEEVPGFAVVRIEDTGTGIPREVIPFVFDPFFTTKPTGVGTGLGLSVAKRVITDHGGEVSIKSKEGKGTTLLIKLPIHGEKEL